MSLQHCVVYFAITGVGGRGLDLWFMWPIMCVCSVYTVTWAGMIQMNSSEQELVSLFPAWVWPWVKKYGLKNMSWREGLSCQSQTAESIHKSFKAVVEFSPGWTQQTNSLLMSWSALWYHSRLSNPGLGSSQAPVLPCDPNLRFSSDCFIWLMPWTCPPPCLLLPQYTTSQEKETNLQPQHCFKHEIMCVL